MKYQYLYEEKAAQLKRWQPLIHHKKPDVRFLTVLLPIVESIYQTLHKSLKTMPVLASKFTDARLQSFLREDAIKLFLPMISKCLVIEMHKQRIQEALSGDTPEARFDDFILQCKTRAMYENVWSCYPVLLQCIERKVEYYQAAMLELFMRLNADIPCIEAELLKQPLHRITKIHASGDTHRQCRRVLIIHGQSLHGEKVRFVYKPRSLSNERFFGALCQWYNKNSESKPLVTANIVAKENYGYCEFIDYETCQYETDVAEFYHALGELTALLLLINGLDIHQENIIAHGKHPVLIDLECIMTPVLRANQYDYPNVGQSLILPRKTNVSKKSKGVDVSGLSGDDKQKSWRKVPRWHKPGTDEMYLVREDLVVKAHGNAPRIDKQKATSITRYQDDFMNGFKSAYQTLLKYREYLASEQSPLFGKAHVSTRYLFRSTSDYSILLSESYHPLLLDDEAHYEEHMGWLNDILPYRPYYKDVVVAESCDLMDGDIPYFESCAHKKVIYDARGNPVDVDLAYSGEEQCRRMLDSLTDTHLAAQMQLISLSFIAHEWNKKEVDEKKQARLQEGMKPTQNQEMIQYLSDAATTTNGFISWPQLSFDTHQSWVSDLSDLTFYNGTMGIAFALAYWSRFYNCEQSRSMTEQILNACYEILRAHPAIGFGLNGYAGMLYAAHAIHQCNYPRAGQIVQLLIQNSQVNPSAHDETFDVMSGISHDITTLLYFAKRYEIDDAIIHEKMAHLKDKCPDPATFCHDEDSFFKSGEPHPPVLSYAHGIAGAAIAFSRYAKRYHDEEAKQWVMKTADLLDKYFDEAQGFWPDMRFASEMASVDEITAQPPAWCGGHVGIGYFYIECYEQWPLLKDRALKRLNDCVRISGRMADEGSLLPNLCCGFYGDIDFLYELKLRLPEAALLSVNAILPRLKEQLPTHEFDKNFISLFRGVPSYLYSQLRAQYPNEMPSALFW